jgi:hypothetical protein
MFPHPQYLRGFPCARCGKKMYKGEFRDYKAIQSYRLSGFCQSCQDLTNQPEPQQSNSNKPSSHSVPEWLKTLTTSGNKEDNEDGGD